MSRKFLLVIASAITLAGPVAATSSLTQSRPSSANQAGAPHAFGAIALPISVTRFDDRWQRVSHSGGVNGQLAPLLRAARQVPRVEQLRLVNASLNQRISYRFDTQPSDYWSTASETLSQSAGDCEDYAVVKMQALKALGVPDKDIFMTIGHDGVAGGIHALLLVRANGQLFVLDNRSDQLVPQSQYRGFYPIMTLGAGAAWLYGYEQGKTPAAIKAMTIAQQSKRQLPLGDSIGSAADRDAKG